jgi:hypothetical protein
MLYGDVGSDPLMGFAARGATAAVVHLYGDDGSVRAVKRLRMVVTTVLWAAAARQLSTKPAATTLEVFGRVQQSWMESGALITSATAQRGMRRACAPFRFVRLSCGTEARRFLQVRCASRSDPRAR